MVPALMCVASACRGGEGEVRLDEALDIRAVRIEGTAATVRIVGNRASDRSEGGVTGTHRLRGPGAQGRAGVSIDADGMMVLSASCAPVLPCHLDVELGLPQGLPVAVDLSSGTVRIEGMAEADVQVDRGDVEVVGGYNARVRIGSGNLHTRLRPGAMLRAVVANGDVEADVPPGGWQVRATAAELTLAGVFLDQQARGVLEVHAPSGNVRLTGMKELASR
jgi:hypothetical protein